MINYYEYLNIRVGTHWKWRRSKIRIFEQVLEEEVGKKSTWCVTPSYFVPFVQPRIYDGIHFISDIKFTERFNSNRKISHSSFPWNWPTNLRRKTFVLLTNLYYVLYITETCRIIISKSGWEVGTVSITWTITKEHLFCQSFARITKHLIHLKVHET